ncbi:MAG: substrate-binding domain-containing protein [Kiritimatiellia bacterium]
MERARRRGAPGGCRFHPAPLAGRKQADLFSGAAWNACSRSSRPTLGGGAGRPRHARFHVRRRDPARSSAIPPPSGRSSTPCWSALEHIRSKGHRRLLLPCHRPFREIRARCIDLVRATFPELALEQAEDMVPSVDLLDGRDWAAFWNRALPRLKPTCVIVWSSLEALSLISYCARTGLRIPRDLSIVALDGNDLMDWFEQPLTHVEADNEADWKAFLRWVDEGCHHDGHIDTTCRFIEGATVATLRP